MIPHAYPLNSLGVLSFAGPEAEQFLQGQVSNDVSLLKPGESQLAAYSSAQGRMLAIFRLVRRDGEILGILPQEILESSLARLRKYVLRAKVDITDARRRITVAGCFVDEEGAASPAAAARIPQDVSRRWLLVDRAPADAEAAPAAQADFERRWRLADVRAGIPQIYAATQEQFVAQMLNLDLIDGISFQKGCYTGQEIIARTQHLGRIKRRMFRLRNAGPAPLPGANLQIDDGRHATVIESAADGAAHESLAVMPLASSSPGQPRPAAMQPLPYAIEVITDR